tara:strand:+ start:4615 stop:5034 length:420 start_codon:yes stop_codon:yes gene_type:complete
MFDFLDNKKKPDNKVNEYVKIAALLIHVAKIDQNYTNDEKEIIKKTLIELGVNKNGIDEIIDNAEKKEENSNQIINFTKEIKNLEENKKIMIVESLWKIIYSDSKSDIYEANLMRRLTGLLYLDNKTVGDLKKKFEKKQ